VGERPAALEHRVETGAGELAHAKHRGEPIAADPADLRLEMTTRAPGLVEERAQTLLRGELHLEQLGAAFDTATGLGPVVGQRADGQDRPGDEGKRDESNPRAAPGHQK
jgi:hypothetical protein